MRLALLLTLPFALGCQKKIPVPGVSAPSDAATVARGEYLGTRLCSCVSCHSPRDWSRWSGPADLARAMSGGENDGPLSGLGEGAVMHAPNLTPTRLRDWSDGELVRAITTGLGKGNHALFPAMPYLEYRAMALDDVLALVAWLRTLPPVVNDTPTRHLPFPLELVVNGIPRPIERRATAPRRGEPDYGEYTTRIAGCVWCHSTVDGRGRIVEGGEFAGGHAFIVPPPGQGQVLSANLSPDATGLGGWTKETFITRFKGFDLAQLQGTALPAGSSNSIMPWAQFHGVSDDDLGAIYDYLRTRPPKSHAVTKFLPK